MTEQDLVGAGRPEGLDGEAPRSRLRCSGCGTEGTGNFCASCGTPLRREGAACAACGSGLAPEALYCSECGEPVARPSRKPVRAYLPWIFAAFALIAFSVAIAVFVQSQSGPRGPDGLITGGLPEPTREPAEVIPAPSAATDGAPGMGGTPDLSTMTPREAADRLFDRSMAEQEMGSPERARFFGEMGLQAYERVPPDRLDADARFHIGLLHLLLGDLPAAGAEAEILLEAESRNLFGLVLALRTAEAAGDEDAARSWGERLRTAVEEGERPDQPPYAPHRAMLEREVERADGG